jgi:hypothetical protein
VGAEISSLGSVDGAEVASGDFCWAWFIVSQSTFSSSNWKPSFRCRNKASMKPGRNGLKRLDCSPWSSEPCEEVRDPTERVGDASGLVCRVVLVLSLSLSIILLHKV